MAHVSQRIHTLNSVRRAVRELGHQFTDARGLRARTKVAARNYAHLLCVPAGGLASRHVRASAPQLLVRAQLGTQVLITGTAADQVAAWRSKLQLHNSMTRSKQAFTPREDQGLRVQMYVCGVTVYDYSHIGHARVYVAFDVLYRLLQFLGFDVQYVRNFTDVDDKILARAAERGEEPAQLTQRFIEAFHEDMASLQCLPPTLEPRATAHIDDMQRDITTMIERGHAYMAPGGDVFFDVTSLDGYGRLARRAQEDNRAGERVAVDARKRHAADFALWKAAKAGEPAWPSPWGDGRPGWHTECSAMIRALMGPVIDIHGGGADLMFPHHENELAQAQACSCCGGRAQPPPHADFVRFWLHNGFVNVDSEKMSKSLGNFFTIRDVTARYHPLALRWFLLCSAYRAPLNYAVRALDDASDRLYSLVATLHAAQQELDSAGDEGAEAIARASVSGGAAGTALVAGVVEALLDDLNTTAALAALAAPLKTINDLLTTRAGRRAKDRFDTLAQLLAGFSRALDVLGLGVDRLEDLLAGLRMCALVRAGLTEADVQARLDARAQARKDKDFSTADQIRVELAAAGVLIMDSPTGTTWRPGATADADA